MMDDPIFAAIAAYEKAAAVFTAQCEYEDWLKEKGIKLPCAADDHRTPEMVTLVNASIAARVALAKTVPTTMAGLLALTGFLREQTTEDVPSFFEGEENLAFVATLDTAVQRLAGLEPQRRRVDGEKGRENAY
jgi:hypothetical protein